MRQRAVRSNSRQRHDGYGLSQFIPARYLRMRLFSRRLLRCSSLCSFWSLDRQRGLIPSRGTTSLTGQGSVPRDWAWKLLIQGSQFLYPIPSNRAPISIFLAINTTRSKVYLYEVFGMNRRVTALHGIESTDRPAVHRTLLITTHIFGNVSARSSHMSVTFMACNKAIPRGVMSLDGCESGQHLYKRGEPIMYRTFFYP